MDHTPEQKQSEISEITPTVDELLYRPVENCPPRRPPILRPTKYLQRDMGRVLSQCLASVCEVRPHDPIDYIAYYLYKIADAEFYYYEKTIFNQQCMLLVLDYRRKQTRKRELLKQIQMKMKELSASIWKGEKRKKSILAQRLSSGIINVNAVQYTEQKALDVLKKMKDAYHATDAYSEDEHSETDENYMKGVVFGMETVTLPRVASVASSLLTYSSSVITDSLTVATQDALSGDTNKTADAHKIDKKMSRILSEDIIDTNVPKIVTEDIETLTLDNDNLDTKMSTIDSMPERIAHKKLVKKIKRKASARDTTKLQTAHASSVKLDKRRQPRPLPRTRPRLNQGVMWSPSVKSKEDLLNILAVPRKSFLEASETQSVITEMARNYFIEAAETELQLVTPTLTAAREEIDAVMSQVSKHALDARHSSGSIVNLPPVDIFIQQLKKQIKVTETQLEKLQKKITQGMRRGLEVGGIISHQNLLKKQKKELHDKLGKQIMASLSSRVPIPKLTSFKEELKPDLGEESLQDTPLSKSASRSPSVISGTKQEPDDVTMTSSVELENLEVQILNVEGEIEACRENLKMEYKHLMEEKDDDEITSIKYMTQKQMKEAEVTKDAKKNDLLQWLYQGSKKIKEKPLFLSNEEIVKKSKAETDKKYASESEHTEEDIWQGLFGVSGDQTKEEYTGTGIWQWPFFESRDPTIKENVTRLQKKIVEEKSLFDQLECDLEKQKLAIDESEKILLENISDGYPEETIVQLKDKITERKARYADLQLDQEKKKLTMADVVDSLMVYMDDDNRSTEDTSNTEDFSSLQSSVKSLQRQLINDYSIYDNLKLEIEEIQRLTEMKKKTLEELSVDSLDEADDTVSRLRREIGEHDSRCVDLVSEIEMTVLSITEKEESLRHLIEYHQSDLANLAAPYDDVTIGPLRRRRSSVSFNLQDTRRTVYDRDSVDSAMSSDHHIPLLKSQITKLKARCSAFDNNLEIRKASLSLREESLVKWMNDRERGVSDEKTFTQLKQIIEVKNIILDDMENNLQKSKMLISLKEKELSDLMRNDQPDQDRPRSGTLHLTSSKTRLSDSIRNVQPDQENRQSGTLHMSSTQTRHLSSQTRFSDSIQNVQPDQEKSATGILHLPSQNRYSHSSKSFMSDEEETNLRRSTSDDHELQKRKDNVWELLGNIKEKKDHLLAVKTKYNKLKESKTHVEDKSKPGPSDDKSARGKTHTLPGKGGKKLRQGDNNLDGSDPTTETTYSLQDERYNESTFRPSDENLDKADRKRGKTFKSKGERGTKPQHSDDNFDETDRTKAKRLTLQADDDLPRLQDPRRKSSEDVRISKRRKRKSPGKTSDGSTDSWVETTPSSSEEDLFPSRSKTKPRTQKTPRRLSGRLSGRLTGGLSSENLEFEGYDQAKPMLFRSRSESDSVFMKNFKALESGKRNMGLLRTQSEENAKIRSQSVSVDDDSLRQRVHRKSSKMPSKRRRRTRDSMGRKSDANEEFSDETSSHGTAIQFKKSTSRSRHKREVKVSSQDELTRYLSYLDEHTEEEDEHHDGDVSTISDLPISEFECNWQLNQHIQLVCKHPVLGAIRTRRPNTFKHNKVDVPKFWESQDFHCQSFYHGEVYTFCPEQDDPISRTGKGRPLNRGNSKLSNMSYDR